MITTKQKSTGEIRKIKRRASKAHDKGKTTNSQRNTAREKDWNMRTTKQSEKRLIR